MKIVKLAQVSFVLVRWGGASEVDPVTEGDGGWGSIGCPVSNRYLARMLACFHEELQGRYEAPPPRGARLLSKSSFSIYGSDSE